MDAVRLRVNRTHLRFELDGPESTTGRPTKWCVRLWDLADQVSMLKQAELVLVPRPYWGRLSRALRGAYGVLQALCWTETSGVLEARFRVRNTAVDTEVWVKPRDLSQSPGGFVLGLRSGSSGLSFELEVVHQGPPLQVPSSRLYTAIVEDIGLDLHDLWRLAVFRLAERQLTKFRLAGTSWMVQASTLAGWIVGGKFPTPWPRMSRASLDLDDLARELGAYFELDPRRLREVIEDIAGSTREEDLWGALPSFTPGSNWTSTSPSRPAHRPGTSSGPSTPTSTEEGSRLSVR